MVSNFSQYKFMKKTIGISILFLLISCKYEHRNENVSNPMQKINQEAVKQHKITNNILCSICGIEFEGSGYEEVSNGIWEECNKPYQCQVCSIECGLEHTANMNGFVEQVKQDDSKCIFENDKQVLSYLIGKTFRSNNGNTEIIFSSDGATVSGKLYQWLSYETLGGFKGYVKLSATSADTPDGVLKLWVSCRENAVTDGKVVLINR